MTVQSLTNLIETELQRLSYSGKPDNLYSPINYLLALGGKRMRPLLVLLGYSLFRDDPEKIIRPAMAVEVFHNFTLMHDDIMDKAPLRRGEPTVHEKWNETIAILSGDTMFVKAYELLEDLDPKLLPSAFKLFNKCAIQVCEGQQMDMDFEDRDDVSEAEYLEMIRLKTAVLLGFSLRLGALLAEADEKTQEQLCELGIAMGMAFQLMDDHLDTFGDETFGKQIGGDIASNKKTFLLINALERSSEGQKVELEKWLSTQGQDEAKIKEVTRIYKEEGLEEISKDRIFQYGQSARNLLSSLTGDASVKALISGYIDKLNQRVK